MNTKDIAEWIANDTSCAQGEFHQRVKAIVPYLTPAADEIERLRAALKEIQEARMPGQARAIAIRAYQQSGGAK